MSARAQRKPWRAHTATVYTLLCAVLLALPWTMAAPLRALSLADAEAAPEAQQAPAGRESVQQRAAPPLQHYRVKVLEQLPHPRENFVQGLQLIGDQLLVGTGGYGESRLRRYRFPQLELQAERILPARLFGEGITQFGERIYQLTWRARLGIVYNAADLQPLATFSLPGEGWGLTHNGSQLIYSDGSDQLYFLDPDTLQRQRTLDVRLRGQPLRELNELEWIDGRIWANIWRTDSIAIIAPDSGVVEGLVDLRGLLPAPLRRADTDVLNGIAVNPQNGDIWVTGKRWPALFRIALEPVL